MCMFILYQDDKLYCFGQKTLPYLKNMLLVAKNQKNVDKMNVSVLEC